MRKLRGFEVVSNEFRKHPDLEISMPIRGTQNSAGYDFVTPVDLKIPPFELVVVHTDIKAYMQSDEFLALFIRSSLGFKHRITLVNTVGIIDSDYYSNINNDGNIGIGLVNYGTQTVHFEAGTRIAQGIFMPFYTADNDFVLNQERKGGIGST